MQATGIQIDGSIIRWATVQKTSDDFRVVELKTIATEDVKLLYKKNFGTLVSGLHAGDLLVRSHTVTPAKGSKIRQALRLQIEAELHIPPEDLLTVSVLHSPEKKATTFSTTRNALAEHLLSFHQLQLDPERVSANPAALQAFVQWKKPELASYFLIDIGLTHADCMWVEKEEIRQMHSIPLGLQTLKKAWVEDRKKTITLLERPDIDFSSLKTSQYPALTEEARIFRREISKILHSFQCQRPLIFTGEIHFLGFREYLLDTLSDCITEEKDLSLSRDEDRAAACLGLAIDYLCNREQPIQFRMNGDVSPKTWHQLGRQSFVLLLAAFVSAGLIHGLGSKWMDQRERELVGRIDAFSQDPAIRAELFSPGIQTKELVSQWVRLVDKNVKDYRFILTAPRVSRFLNDLTHHPLVESFRLAGDPLSFEEIHYSLVSCPRLESQQDPYLVKIELEFKTNSPLYARKFHEMLTQGNEMIDASREVTWDVLTDRTKTTFYLKNR